MVFLIAMASTTEQEGRSPELVTRGEQVKAGATRLLKDAENPVKVWEITKGEGVGESVYEQARYGFGQLRVFVRKCSDWLWEHSNTLPGDEQPFGLHIYHPLPDTKEGVTRLVDEQVAFLQDGTWDYDLELLRFSPMGERLSNPDYQATLYEFLPNSGATNQEVDSFWSALEGATEHEAVQALQESGALQYHLQPEVSRRRLDQILTLVAALGREDELPPEADDYTGIESLM